MTLKGYPPTEMHTCGAKGSARYSQNKLNYIKIIPPGESRENNKTDNETESLRKTKCALKLNIDKKLYFTNVFFSVWKVTDIQDKDDVLHNLLFASC